MTDEPSFAEHVERHRRELHVHCYRMLGNFEEAEDVVQETFLRAWNRRDTFAGGSYRAWLYRIATNACLDALRRTARRVPALTSYAEIPWLQPYPDRLLDEVAPRDDEPDAVLVAKETIELAYLAVVQLLPPRQRAVLIMRDILGWPANEVAETLDMTVAAANSALQRARATLQENLPKQPSDWSASQPTAEERALVQRFIDAHERQDVAASVAMMREDIRISMPPYPYRFDGLAAIAQQLERAFGPESPGDWRLLATRANRMPAAASYLRAPGDTRYRGFKLDVMRVEGGLITDVTTFGHSLFPHFGLPEFLD
jgi:RNA polymerase sigma-70 factor (ECF subfamily)